MSTFTIELCPPVPAAPCPQTDISLGELPIEEIIDAFPQTYDVRYYVNNIMFCYYPASILTILNDIHLEWELIRKRESHDMTLSGYTVLELAFSGACASFYDPIERARDSKAKPVGSNFDAAIIEDSFKDALDSVWSLIRARVGG